jgi:hypothetical protein
MVVAALLATPACSEPDDDGHGLPDARDTSHDDGAADADADGDAPRDEVTIPDYTDDNVCDEQNFDFHHEIVRIMILLDQSSSMIGASWAAVTGALELLLADPAFEDMYFGLDAFPDGYPNDWADCPPLCANLSCMTDSCGFLHPPQVPIDISYLSRDAIIAHMRDPAFPQRCTNTPLVNQIEYYDTGEGSTAAPQLYDAEGDNYLLVVSDGEDANCFEGEPVSALATHVESIRTTHDIRSFAIGITGTTTGLLADELNAIASHGGTAFTTFLRADDEAGLTAALDSIASSVITCEYVLDDPRPGADPNHVNFYLDDVTVPRDADCTEDAGAGWDWVDPEHTTVRFCGDFCARIRSGTIGEISATFGCETIII